MSPQGENGDDHEGHAERRDRQLPGEDGHDEQRRADAFPDETESLEDAERMVESDARFIFVIHGTGSFKL